MHQISQKKPLNLFAAILKAMNIFLGFGWGIFSELGGVRDFEENES